jgi:histidine triad (HIT) family protein
MPPDPNCVFCRIVGGEIPCHKVHETQHGLAFLDIGPLADGHLLWIPRAHVASLHDLEESQAADLCRTLPRLGRALQEVVRAEGYNLLQNNGRVAGQEVMHVHFHLIPRRAGDGLGYRWNPGQYQPGRAEALAQDLQAALAEG